jgi:hypothetical protein
VTHNVLAPRSFRSEVFLAWKIGPQEFLFPRSLSLHRPPAAGSVKAAARGFSPLTGYLDWLCSAFWHITFRTSSLIN